MESNFHLSDGIKLWSEFYPKLMFHEKSHGDVVGEPELVACLKIGLDLQRTLHLKPSTKTDLDEASIDSKGCHAKSKSSRHAETSSASCKPE